MSYKHPIGEKDILQKRLSTNPKYQGVKAVVETGLTAELGKYMRDAAIKLKRQPGELFGRVSPCTVANFVRKRYQMVSQKMMQDGGFAYPMAEYNGAPVCGPLATDPKLGNIDLLVLDCRSEEDYMACHILGALHYPRIRLNHTINPFLSEMFAYKNKEGKLIVVYDLDESIAPELANFVYQRGIDNVVIMAGGLAEFVQDYADLILGKSPVPILPRDIRLQRRANEAVLARSEAKSLMSHKPKSLSNSLATLPMRKR